MKSPSLSLSKGKGLSLLKISSCRKRSNKERNEVDEESMLLKMDKYSFLNEHKRMKVSIDGLKANNLELQKYKALVD